MLLSEREIPVGTFFFHGSPNFFKTPKNGSYLATYPMLSLAILTEHANGIGYFYVYLNRQPIKPNKRSVVPLIFRKPTPVDSLWEQGIKFPKGDLIAFSNFYEEYILDDTSNQLQLEMIYTIDIEHLRARAKALVANNIKYPKYLESSAEKALIEEFLPTYNYTSLKPKRIIAPDFGDDVYSDDEE